MAVVHLIRHTAVARHWAGRCYGRSDVGLSREGREAARMVAPRAGVLGISRLYASPLRRARFLAGLIAREAAIDRLVIDARLMECDFGAWEGAAWDTIYAESGDAMMGLVTAPDVFRPGGSGEATYTMRDRAMDWLRDAVSEGPDCIAAVCHGGPIAAIRGTLSGAAVADWPALVPRHGEIVTLEVGG